MDPTSATADAIRTVIVVAMYVAGATGVLLIVTRFIPSGRALVHRLIGGQELWFAFGCAVAMTAASLFLSEGLGYVPCRWCWFQRVFAYSNVIVLGWGAFRRDRNAWGPALTLAGLGIAISTWHIALDLGWVEDLGACDVSIPCTARWLGFDQDWNTIQIGAFCCFLFIIGMGLHGLTGDRADDQAEHGDDDSDHSDLPDPEPALEA